MIWEYKVERRDTFADLERTLTFYGHDGWELVTIIPEAQMRLIFKRPKDTK